MGTGADYLVGVGKPDLSQEGRDRFSKNALRSAATRLVAGRRPLDVDHLPADLEHRVERGERVLEDHGDLRPAHFSERLLAQPGEVDRAVQEDLARELCGHWQEEAQYGEGKGALAGTGLAY